MFRKLCINKTNEKSLFSILFILLNKEFKLFVLTIQYNLRHDEENVITLQSGNFPSVKNNLEIQQISSSSFKKMHEVCGNVVNTIYKSRHVFNELRNIVNTLYKRRHVFNEL